MLTAGKVLVLDPVLATIFMLLTVWCIIRLSVSIWVYHDAAGLGRDAMGWMGLVCVLGLMGLVVWMVIRSKSRYPYAYQIPYYPTAPPGQMYRMQYQPVMPPYPTPETERPVSKRPAPDQSAPDAPKMPPMPTEPAPPKETALPKAHQISEIPKTLPEPQMGPQPAQMHPPPPGYYYATPQTQWKSTQFNPYAVRRMVATFVAAIAFANYIVTPVMMAWMLRLPDLNVDTFLTDILTPEMILLSTAIQDGLLVYFTWLVMFRHKHLTLPGLGLKWNERTPRLILLGLLAALALVAVNFAVSWPLEQSGIAQGSQSIFDMRGRPWGLFLIGIATVGIAPVTEELFFRGYALATIERKWGPFPGVFLSALMFSAVHMSIVSLLPIFAIGIILAMLCRKFGLVPCIIAHAVNNLLAILLIYLGYG